MVFLLGLNFVLPRGFRFFRSLIGRAIRSPVRRLYCPGAALSVQGWGVLGRLDGLDGPPHQLQELLDVEPPLEGDVHLPVRSPEAVPRSEADPLESLRVDGDLLVVHHLGDAGELLLVRVRSELHLDPLRAVQRDRDVRPDVVLPVCVHCLSLRPLLSHSGEHKSIS